MTGPQDGHATPSSSDTRAIVAKHFDRLAHELRTLGLITETALFPCLKVTGSAGSVMILAATEHYYRPVDRGLKCVGPLDEYAEVARTIRDDLSGNGGKR